jgi:hypothetical protein
MNPRFLIALSIASLLTLVRVFAQPVVVSEYYNDNPPQEWTEILVLEDNLDLRGWVVTDNNASQTARQGGVRFKSIPYWQHVRAGTIIGIWHRDYISNSPQDFDTSMADGRVMLAKNDTRFFDPYAAPDVQFPDAPMNLAQEGDIMEIFDAQGNHVHGLGHRATPGSYWLAMPEPKLNTASALNNGQSNRVFPGSVLSQYNGPHGAPLSEACAVNITRTLPNKSCSSSVSNWEFWHAARRPQWTFPRLQATVTSSNVQLAWNSALDPYPQDSTQGYLLVRDSAGQDFLPEQGRIYRDGERIGSTVVLAHLPSTATSYIDPVSLVCGVSYTYRLFAYRYGQDDEYGAYPPPQSTRGRQYNIASFAQVTALKQVEQGPALRTDGSPTTFCDGGSVVLSVPSIPPGYQAQWLRDGAAISGATSTTYRATTGGEYRLRLRRPDGCFVLSDSVIVTVHPSPTVTTFPTSRVQLCEDSTLLITAPYVPGWRYQWYRNATPIAGATSASYLASSAGSYTVEVTNEFGCTAQSPPTTIELLQVRLQASQVTVAFPSLSGCESVSEAVITLTNQSSIPIELERGQEPSPFFIVAPSLPAQLKVGEQIAVRLRFAPMTAGTWTDSIGVRILPCGRVLWIRVQGTKSGAAGALSAQSSIQDFGVIKRCGGTVLPTLDSIIVSASSGDVTVESIAVSAPFRLGAGFPGTFTLRAGEQRAIPLEFAPLLDQPYSGDITIRYSSAQCRDSLKIPLRGVLTTPYIALSAREIVFPTLDSCSTIFADTTITLYNTSLAPIELEQLPDEQLQIVQPIPAPTLTIPPRDSVVIRIRYSPNGYTASEQRLIILFGDQRCTQSEVLIVRGMRIGSSASLNTTTLTLGRILRCRDTALLARQVQLSISSTPPNGAGNRIVSVSSSAPWIEPSVPLGPIDDGTHPIQLTVDPRNLPLGSDTAQLSLRIEPCSRILTLSVVAQVEDLVLGFEESNGGDTLRIDVGDVRIGSTATARATIFNPNRDTISFAPIGPLPAWLQLSFPFLQEGIAPQATSVGTITITPTDPGIVQHTIILNAVEPCTKRLVILINGRGVRDSIGASPIALRISIPESLVASPGEHVRYSVQCDGVARPLSIESMTIPIHFDRSLLAIEDISSGPAFSAGTVGSTLVADGYQLELRSGTITGNGTIAMLSGRVLLGKVRRTAITPDQRGIAISDTTVRVIAVEPGWLELREACNLDARLVQLGSHTSIEVHDDGSTLSFLVRQIVRADAELSLYDVTGRRALLLHRGMLERGEHTFTVGRSSLPAGMYFLVFTTDQLRRSVAVLLD